MKRITIYSMIMGLFLGLSSTNSYAIDMDAAFKRADRNGNRNLNRSEFDRFVRDLSKRGHRLAQRATRFGSLGMNRAWATADSNKDGKVSIKELERLR